MRRTGRRPSRKRTGRSGPPPRYPKDQDLYADPENWKYPVHTPVHARAARRFFNKPYNRAAYDAEEQLYIDSRINQALRRFGVEPSSIPSTPGRITGRGVIEEEPPPNVQFATFDQCLRFLVGETRLRRARSMKDEEVTILRNDEQVLKARIRSYNVEIDLETKTIRHDCADWGRRKTVNKLCKHLGKALLTLPEEKAHTLLKEIITEPKSWHLE